MRSVSASLQIPPEDRGVLGRQHVEFMAGLSAMFAGWCDGAEGDAAALSSIYFDKLGNLTARTWRAANGPMRSQFFGPCPYEELPGTHGPGQALTHHRGLKPRFLVPCLYEVQLAVPERSLFEIRPGVTEEGGVRASHPDTLVLPATPRPDLSRALDRLAGGISDVLGPLAEALPDLDQNELRAVGTHCSSEQTVEAVQFLIAKLRTTWDGYRPELVERRPPSDGVARDMEVFCGELHRKTIDNPGRYEVALTKIDDACESEHPASVAFHHVYDRREDVWGSEVVKSEGGKAGQRRALAKVFSVVSGGQQNEEQFSEAWEELPRGTPALPRRLGSLFDGGLLSTDGAIALRELGDSLFGGVL